MVFIGMSWVGRMIGDAGLVVIPRPPGQDSGVPEFIPGEERRRACAAPPACSSAHSDAHRSGGKAAHAGNHLEAAARADAEGADYPGAAVAHVEVAASAAQR